MTMEGMIFDLDTFAVHDGPGIRMAVYLKGCPHSCRWCHSPESRSPQAELILLHDRCIGCGVCVGVCTNHAHELRDGNHLIKRELCTACGRCCEYCPQHALAIKGYPISVETLVNKARRMKPFFTHSGGGITLTGGEVTGQADFAAEVLKRCRAEGIHTAIETSGACNWEALSQVVAHADLILYDLKLIDDTAHRYWVGASNQIILANAVRLAGHNLQVCVPLIPGITDTEENLAGIFAFMHSAGLATVALLPYNPSAAAKYEWIGQQYEITGEVQRAEQLRGFVEMARAAGIDAVIS
ncbi:MAG: glycyl-radical enzyme activating protein [bacterium]